MQVIIELYEIIITFGGHKKGKTLEAKRWNRDWYKRKNKKDYSQVLQDVKLR